MTWRDQLRPATFRGVPFEIEAREGQGGRRLAVHEYPGRDLPYAEDLGRSARLRSFDAFVVGDDYFAGRDRLIEALEKPGPGTLVDPWLGEIQVAVQSFSWRETTREGRLARFQVAFVEAGARRHPAVATDTKAAVTSAADGALTASQAAFASVYSVDGLPQFVADAAEAIGTDFATVIEGLAGTLPVTAAGAIAAADAVDGMISDIASLARAGTEFAARIVSTTQALTGAVSDPLALSGAMATLAAFGGDLAAVPTATTTRLQQAANQEAITRLARRAAVSERARAVLDLTFASYDDAVAVRDDLAAALDAEISAAGTPIAGQGADDQAFTALRSLRAAMVRDIDTRGADLARVVSIANPDTRPALAVAYALYGDATRDAELATRNGIAHPGFVAFDRLDVLNA